METLDSANDTSDKKLISKICKKLTELNMRGADLIIKLAEDLKRFFQRRYTDSQQVGKRCSTSLTIREKQIKTTRRYHLSLVARAIIKNL